MAQLGKKEVDLNPRGAGTTATLCVPYKCPRAIKLWAVDPCYGTHQPDAGRGGGCLGQCSVNPRGGTGWYLQTYTSVYHSLEG